MLKKIIYLFLLLLSIESQATTMEISGDASQVQVIGFSKDGLYFAFERYGTYDGSAFPYSEIFILDVCKNDYAVKPILLVIEDGSDESIARTNNMKKAEPLLNRFGIQKGNTGNKILLKPTENKKFSFPFKNEKMEIILDEIETKSLNCEESIPEKKMILSLKYKGIVQALQKDDELPKSRNCAFDYWISEVYSFNNGIVAIVNYRTPGFEGPNTRQIAVSGCLNQ